MTGVLTVILVAIYLGATWLNKRPDFNCAFLTILVLGFFSYGRAVDWFPGISLGGHTIGKNKVLIPTYTLVVTGAIWVLSQIQHSYLVLTNRLATQTFNILLIIVTIQGVYRQYGVQRPKITAVSSVIQQDKLKVNRVQPANNSPGNKHNIYLIILDSYCSEDSLKEFYHFDNKNFNEDLKHLDFLIYPRNKANYPFTALSMAGTFNMDYVQIISETPGSFSIKDSMRLLEKNRVNIFLSNHGYNLYTTHSWVNSLNFMKSQGSWLEDLHSNEFFMALLHTTFLRPFEGEIFADLLRKGLLRQFDLLGNPNRFKSPAFIYAHIICPHPPYIFNADGSKPNKITSVIGRVENQRGYLNQLQYMNFKTIEAIKRILSEDHTDPIILLQADHGHGYILGDHLLSKARPPHAFLQAQFGILFASRFPDDVKVPFYDGMTPINEFRILFNALFGANMPILEDRQYFTKITEPWNFIEISDEFKN